MIITINILIPYIFYILHIYLYTPYLNLAYLHLKLILYIKYYVLCIMYYVLCIMYYVLLLLSSLLSLSLPLSLLFQFIVVCIYNVFRVWSFGAIFPASGFPNLQKKSVGTTD